MDRPQEHVIACADCGVTGEERPISNYTGLVNVPNDEGCVQHTNVALCSRCADKRIAKQESPFL